MKKIVMSLVLHSGILGMISVHIYILLVSTQTTIFFSFLNITIQTCVYFCWALNKEQTPGTITETQNLE